MAVVNTAQHPGWLDTSQPISASEAAAYNLSVGAFRSGDALATSTNQALSAAEAGAAEAQSNLATGMASGQNQLTAGQGMLEKTYAKGKEANASALDAYFGALGISTNGAPTDNSAVLNQLRNTPGYQFTQQQGLNQINANAATKGSLVSGNTLKEALDYSTGLADSTYQSYVKNLGDAVGLTKTYVDNFASLSSSLYGQSASLYGQQAVTSSNISLNKGNTLAALYSAYGENMAGVYSNLSGGVTAASGGGGGGGGGGGSSGSNAIQAFGKMLGADVNPTVYNSTYYTNQGGNGLGGVNTGWSS